MPARTTDRRIGPYLPFIVSCDDGTTRINASMLDAATVAGRKGELQTATIAIKATLSSRAGAWLDRCIGRQRA